MNSFATNALGAFANATSPCPQSRPDLWNKLKPAADIIAGDIIGLKPLIIVVVVVLVVALGIAAMIPAARAWIISALSWILGALVVGGLVIAVVVTLSNSAIC